MCSKPAAEKCGSSMVLYFLASHESLRGYRFFDKSGHCIVSISIMALRRTTWCSDIWDSADESSESGSMPWGYCNPSIKLTPGDFWWVSVMKWILHMEPFQVSKCQLLTISVNISLAAPINIGASSMSAAFSFNRVYCRPKPAIRPSPWATPTSQLPEIF